jgi:hypothetical protein
LFVRFWEIFDTVLMDDYPELGGHLAANAAIVSNPIFVKQAVSKIAKGHPISEEERDSVSCLLKLVMVEVDVADGVNDHGGETGSNELINSVNTVPYA